MAQTLEYRNKVFHTKEDHSELIVKIKQCTNCQELVKTRNQSVPGYGDVYAKVLLIGEAPGRLGADVTGIPFTRDRSGVFLQKMLCKIGMNESDPQCEIPVLKNVYITNIVKCNPQSSSGTNRSPQAIEIQECMGYLSQEIAIIKPRIIVTLGLPASKALLGDKFNGKDFGKFIKMDKFIVLPLWHPAFVIRGGGVQRMNEEKYSKYFFKIKRFLARIDLNE